jgi:hypothetical protein
MLQDFADWHVEPTDAGFIVVAYERQGGDVLRYVYFLDGEVEVFETEAEAAETARRMRGTIH